MNNEVINSIVASVKRKPTGAIVGGIAGYFICTKLIKTSDLLIVIPSVLIVALVGSAIEYKLTEVKPVNSDNKRINKN